MRKFILVSIVVALVGAMVVPALLSPGSAEAWWFSSKPVVACDTQVLEITAIQGVNPAAKNIGVYNGGTGTLWWKVKDSAGWLSLWPTLGSSRGEVDNVRVTINSKNLAPGDYSATITVSNALRSSEYVTVQVKLTVVEPTVMGPIMLGMEGIWPWSPDYEYKGTAANLLVGPEGMGDLSNAGVEVKDCWELSLDVDLEAGYITGGILAGSGTLPSGNILGGQILGLEALLGDLGELLGDNYIVTMLIDAGEEGMLTYAGMLLTDIDGLLNGIPELLDLLGSTSSSSQEIEPMSQGITVPLGPIMELLPKLLPLMGDLLPVLLPIIEPIAGFIPPVIVIMPAELMWELMELLMP